MKKLTLLLSLLTLSLLQWACTPSAQDIIDHAIKTHGGDAYNELNVAFDFRDKHYILEKKGGDFRYERQQKDSLGIETIDILTNDSFQRTTNGKTTIVPDSMIAAYSSSINSVAYFFLLPAPLNDAAANKKLLAQTIIKGEPYQQVEVTFKQEGGGEDFQDRYIFWIHKTNKTLDYLAYSYEVNGGGVRFREAYNVQNQKGLRFCDYRNYGFEDTNTALEELPKLFESGKIPLLSSIENKNVVVN